MVDRAGGLYLGYPFGWSPVQIYYDPAQRVAGA